MRAGPALPVAAACLGIALFVCMDVTMKGLSLAVGVYSAMLFRQALGAAIAAGPYLLSKQAWPSKAAMRFHLLRGVVGAAMAFSWFYGLARLPVAEAIALSFIAPLVALYLASVLLGERIGRASIAASLLGVAGVGVLIAARLVDARGPSSVEGVASILVSSMLYAWNLVLMRQQAQVAGPAEVAFFQNAISGSCFLAVLPAMLALRPELVILPTGIQWALVALGAALTVTSLFLLSWAYGRAEAQLLVPVEYTGFLWGAVLGAIFFAERLTQTTLAGAALIIAGCIIVARQRPASAPAVEVAA